MKAPHLRRGYTTLMDAYDEGLDSAGWLALTENLLQFPGWMVPAVRLAVQKGIWRQANDPVKCVRENAQREAGRSGLSAEPSGPNINLTSGDTEGNAERVVGGKPEASRPSVPQNQGIRRFELNVIPLSYFSKTFSMSPTFFWILPAIFSSVPSNSKSGLLVARCCGRHRKTSGDGKSS
jgi:hypothetical protein